MQAYIYGPVLQDQQQACRTRLQQCVKFQLAGLTFTSIGVARDSIFLLLQQQMHCQQRSMPVRCKGLPGPSAGTAGVAAQ
jgi:hypothetical protein